MHDPKGLLKDPTTPLSSCWKALETLLGKMVPVYEPDTIRIELSRRGVDPTPGLMAKLLAAQTILVGYEWTYDYDVFFAFTLACDNIPSASDAIHHPTPEQLCWAIHEIAAVMGHTPDSEEGFDPDTVDPAIAVVLHDEGMIVAPDELSFIQEVLEGFQPDSEALRSEVQAAWENLRHLPISELEKVAGDLPEDEKGVQLKRLADCRRYVAEREDRRGLIASST